MDASNEKTAAKGLRGWWAFPPQSGMQRLINPWEYRHLRVSGAARIAGGSVGVALVVLLLSYTAYGWAAFFLVVAALNLAGGGWYLTIARSASPRTLARAPRTGLVGAGRSSGLPVAEKLPLYGERTQNAAIGVRAHEHAKRCGDGWEATRPGPLCPRFDEALRRPGRVPGRLVRDWLRRGLRLPRAERRREDDNRPHAGHTPCADRRLGDGRRLAVSAENGEQSANASRSCRRRRASTSADRRGEPGVLRGSLCVARCRRAHRARPACRQSHRAGQRCVRQAVQGVAPAGQFGQGAAQRRGGALPG